MNNQDISLLLTIIDQWLADLDDRQLGDAYDRSSRDFFRFLKDYDCNVGRVVNLIKRYSGMTPQQIKTRNDAQQLRDMITRYESSEALGRRVKPEQLANPGNWAYENTAYCFDEQDEPPC